MIEVITREEKAEKTRKKGLIPGILYGKKHLKIAIKRENINQLKKDEKIKFVLNGEELEGIIKDIQKDPINFEVIHFDLYLGE